MTDEDFRRPLSELWDWKVGELRKYARKLPELLIHGRDISLASRTDLLQYIKSSEESARTVAATVSRDSNSH